jgi:hypothetical protein
VVCELGQHLACGGVDGGDHGRCVNKWSKEWNEYKR